MTFPIIRLEISGMKHTIVAALTERAAQIDEDIRAAVDSYCTDQNLANVVMGAAKSALDAAIKEEVAAFFRYGNGRKAVAQAVKESILKNYTYTPLDDVQ